MQTQPILLPLSGYDDKIVQKFLKSELFMLEVDHYIDIFHLGISMDLPHIFHSLYTSYS